MADENYIMVSMDDTRLKKIAEVLGNKTCKKILDYLAGEKEASVKDVSDALKIPINTSEYNVKKLLEADLIQKRSNFFWSKKGKKIVMYELSNKSIVISPKNSSVRNKLKSIVPGFVLVGAMSFAVYVYETIKAGGEQVIQAMPARGEILMAGGQMMNDVGYDFGGSTVPMLWNWFMAGGLLALFIFSIINWKKL